MNLQNLLDFSKFNNIDIFVGVSVPAPLDSETVKSAIMVRCGLLMPIYSEPELFRDTVSHWFTVKQWTFEHLINIIKAEYSPIENFDRYEEYTEVKTGNENEKKNGSFTDKNSGSDKESTNGTYKDTHGGSDTETIENTVSAYNSNSYQPDTKTTNNTNFNKTLSNTHEDERTTTYGKQTANKHEDARTLENAENMSHSGHLHGNIGVTTNQQMIEQELELLKHFDIYGFIASEFEKDNMLMIY